MRDKQGRWTPVVGVHPISSRQIKRIQDLAKGEGTAAEAARRRLANMRLPGETGAEFVQRQLLDEQALDFLAAQTKAGAEKAQMSARLSEDMQIEQRAIPGRREANVEAFGLRDPASHGVRS